MMSSFEAQILIQQSARVAGGSRSPKNQSVGTNAVTSSSDPESVLRLALQTHRLNPNILFQNTSLLSTTIKLDCPNLLKLFLEYGANPNLKSYENGRYEPALITAVRYKSLRSVQILLQYGADLCYTNFYGTDAIFQAIHENAYEILDNLLYQHHHCADSAKQGVRQSHRKSNSASAHHPKMDTPTAALLLSSSATLPHSARQPITIQKTTSTTKPKQNKGTSLSSSSSSSPTKDPAGVEPLTDKKPCNNNSKDHSRHYDDHVLCPFYYALHHSLSSTSKRNSLALLLQSYYRCKCLEEMSAFSCNGESAAAYNRLVLEIGNFSPDKSLPGRGTPSESHAKVDYLVQAGGDRLVNNNESPRNLYPYKVYRIRGKCHDIKENESSSAGRRTVADYVFVLGGPLKLSCITREVIRDQIMRSTQTTCTTSVNAPTSPVNATSISTGENLKAVIAGATVTTVASISRGENPAESRNVSGEIWGKRSFRQSLESLMLPSSLMDYILYKNVQWGRGRETRGESSSHSVQLIKRDLQSNINYLGIYIY